MALGPGVGLARGETISLAVHVTTDNPGGDLNRLVPGDWVHFELAVAVDNSAGSAVPDNAGLHTVIYDLLSPQAMSAGYPLAPMQDAFSGFGVNGAALISDPLLVSSPSGGAPDYGGGWGFDRGGLGGGGDVSSSPGSIIGAMAAAPPTWFPDVDPITPGNQPPFRYGVGLGPYTFPTDDPVLAGHLGGFGFSVQLGNVNHITDGDGSWVFQHGTLDTSGWTPQQYNFRVLPTTGAILVYNPVIPEPEPPTYVSSDEMTGASVSFTLIPEPAAVWPIGIACVAVVRRSRVT